MDELELMKELKKKTLEKIIEKHGGANLGKSLTGVKLSIWDVRNIMYQEALTIAERELKDNFQKELQEWQERR